MRKLTVVALVMAVLCPVAAAAQGVSAGTVELSGVTALTFASQTISPKDADGDLDAKNTSGVLGLHFYLTNRFSIGVAAGFTKASLGIEDSEVSLTTMLGGPQVKARFGSDKTALVLMGGAGITKLKIDAQGDDLEGVDGGLFESTGFYWEAGADIALFLRDNISANIGARYTMSRAKDQDDFEFDTAGLSIGVGFSFFFGGR